MSQYDKIEPLLVQLESQLRTMRLWDIEPPSETALSSQAPFSHDTLEFYQWLQWIFVPRTKMLLRNRAELPTRSDIHSMAEMNFKSKHIEASELLATLQSIDHCFRAENQ